MILIFDENNQYVGASKNIGANPEYRYIRVKEYDSSNLYALMNNRVEVTGKVDVFEEGLEELAESRYKRLEEIFTSKILKLKAIAIDEPWASDIEYIRVQTLVYDELYRNAKDGVFAPKVNALVISKHESVRAWVAPLTYLLNTIKSILRTKIENHEDDVEDLLEVLADFEIANEDTVLEQSEQIKTVFGL